MKLYDKKDVRIVAIAISDVGPNDTTQRASMIVETALMAFVMPHDLISAAKLMSYEMSRGLALPLNKGADDESSI